MPATDAPSTAISIANLVYRRADRQFELVVDQWSVPTGQSVVITGTSGSGKTTLLSLICGQLTPEQGTLLTCGVNLTELSDQQKLAFRRHQIGFVFQGFRLIDHLTVRDNIRLLDYLDRETVSPPDEQNVESIAERCGISHLLNRYPQRLSHGEQQRVAVARALYRAPQLVLADEPTGNLDPANARMILDLLRETCRHSGSTLIVVTHNHQDLELFDRHNDLSEIIVASSQV